MLNRQFKPNPAQLRIMMLMMKIIINIWPRGQGKTNAIAWIITQFVHTLPRGTSLFLGRTYVDLFTNIVPEVKKGLAQRGYIEGIHYFDGKKPPESFHYPAPISPLKEYDRAMYWYTGHVILFASQDREGANRGGSVDFVILDEMLNIKKESFEKEILPKRRGNKDIFGHIPIHHGIFGCSSKPIGADGDWVYQYGSYYLENGHSYEALIRELTDIELEFIDADSMSKRTELWDVIKRIQKELQWYPHKGVFYNECRIWNNIDNLSWNYIKEQRRIMSTTHFRIEMLNDYFSLLEKAFYPSFKESLHVDLDTYDYSRITDEMLNNKESQKPWWFSDYNPNMPMIVGQDYGVNINYMLAAQRYQSSKELRVQKEFFVKAPKWTKDVVELFCEYYNEHSHKYIYYHYDHTGNNRQANAPKLADECVEVFNKYGWTVERCTQGAAINPDDKFNLMQRIFAESYDNELYVRINGHGCPNLVKSIKLSPVKRTNKGLAKDKSSEDPRKNIPQEIATHPSDTLDFIVCGEHKRQEVDAGATMSTHFL